MAGGWTRDGAVQDEIDDTIADAVNFARTRMLAGEGETHCELCGEEIPEARRKALPGARTCVPASRTGIPAPRAGHLTAGAARKASFDSDWSVDSGPKVHRQAFSISTVF